MLTYLQRAELASHKTAKKLLSLMAQKQTNLAVSADLIHMQELLALADQVGPSICVFKTHIDIVTDFSQAGIKELCALANKHQFLIFEDRKFADIGNTVRLQYEKGIYHIAEWADIINAHIIPGPGIIEGLKKENRGLLLLAEMSSKGSLATGDYTKAAVKMAEQYRDYVIGFITQHRLTDDPTFIHLTPGVQLETKNDALGQQYITPEQAILEQGNDIIIVGRGIYAAENPQKTAELYRQAGWAAYQQRQKNAFK